MFLSCKIITFKDVTAGLVIEKIDAQHPAILLEGARFQVVSNTDNTVIGEYVTGKDGLALVDGLEPGLYNFNNSAWNRLISVFISYINTLWLM